MKRIISTISCVLAIVFASAQTNLEVANAAFANKEYSTAIELYQKVLEKPKGTKGIAEIKFNVAESYRHTGKLDKALVWYDNAKNAGYPGANYLFHQGNIYLRQGNYDSAAVKFESFLAAEPNDKDATRLLNNSRQAMASASEPVFYTVKNEAGLNSAFNDYALFPFREKVIFTSSRLDSKEDKVYAYDGEGFSDLYSAEYIKEDKTWSKPKKLELLNTPFNEGVASYCDKTKTAYFTKCNDAKSKNKFCGIVESAYNEQTNTWSAPKAIALAEKQTADMEQPAISPSGRTLYFTSKMEGGNGGSDIWYMRKSGDEWSKPQNAGPIINTDQDEMFPVATDSVLYFSSDGHTGLGGLDLFYSATAADGGFAKPTNLKAPFNSSADDFFIIYTNAGKTTGYFTSNKAGGTGGDDIYSFYLTPVLLTVKGKISDVDGNKPLVGAKVVLTATDGTSDTTYTNTNGEYAFTLDKDKDYKINVIAPGYFGDSRKLTTMGELYSKEFSKANGQNYDFTIRRIPKEEIKIEDIFYDYDSYNLREESKPSLDKLVKLLEDTPNALVQLNSHTDERGKFDYNMKLSENRAKSVVEYLVSKGISQGRLTFKGFASSQPVVKNAKTEEEHQKNRRTTFQVLNNDEK
jgi:peptidoglycan-associated lipoprotein